MTVTSAVLGVSYLTHVPQARTDDDGTTEDGTTDSHVDFLNLIVDDTNMDSVIPPFWEQKPPPDLVGLSGQ